MLFTEPTFLFVFLPAVLLLYAVRVATWRNWLLLVASLVFYARGAGSFTSLVLASIAFNYVAALTVDRWRGQPRGRWALRGAIAINLAVLGVFKYADFAVENVNLALVAIGRQPFALPHLLLPIGISFFTFHAISYVVDVHRRDASAQKRPVEAALYLLVFPQLIAGPIVRYRQIADQFRGRVRTSEDLATGIRRFIVGLGKKMLIANTLAGPADRIFALPVTELTTPLAWVGVICYTLQIYFDFSGYSDMAIGLARMFGFHFPENFNYPYVATSVQDFWRRWHMSLSAWFRDYVYIPLGGSRTSPGRTYVNLVVVFFLCGLWHGASWTFVVWGLFHGAFLVVERLGPGAWLTRLPRPLQHLYLCLVMMIGWTFFRADSLAGALTMVTAMAGRGATTSPFGVGWFLTTDVWLALVSGSVAATPVLPWMRSRWVGRERPPETLPTWAASATTMALALLLAASIALVAGRSYNPFIYFRF